MSSDDESMGSASEYSYHSESEEEDGRYNGESKKSSPVHNKSSGEPYALLSHDDLNRLLP